MNEQNIDFKFAALWKRAVAFIVDVAIVIGYFMAAFSERKQTLHDLLAGTLVVTKEGVSFSQDKPNKSMDVMVKQRLFLLRFL